MEDVKESTDSMIQQFTGNTVESADAVAALLGPNDFMRDEFPLPTRDERDEWLQCWSDEGILLRIICGIISHGNFTIEPGNQAMMCLQYFAQLKRFFQELSSDDQNKFFRSVQVRFLMRVYFPCMALQFQSPATLLQKMQQSKDISLLETAANLDPTIIHHKQIAALLNPPTSRQRRETWNLLASRLASQSKSTSRRKVIYTSSAMLRWVTKAWGMQLKLSSISNQYDKHASTQKGLLRDPDIPATPDTFRKEVGRIFKHFPGMG